jgi:flavin-dependent dehydrogenase
VGDAAALIDPLSGEGIAYALESGHMAAQAVARALRSGRLTELARYDTAVWKELSLEFLGAYLLRRVLAKPWGNGLMVRLMQRDAGLARGGVGVLSNTVPATWLLRPMIWRRVFTAQRLTRVVSARR